MKRGNLRRTISTPLPKRKRGGDCDRDACRRPCCLFSRALLRSLECSLKFTLVFPVFSSVYLFFSPPAFTLSDISSSGLIYFFSPPLPLTYLLLFLSRSPLVCLHCFLYENWCLQEPVKRCSFIVLLFCLKSNSLLITQQFYPPTF